MKSRHKAREIALQILYQYDLNQFSKPKDHLIKNTQPSGPSVNEQPQVSILALASHQELSLDLQRHFEHFNVPEPLREFVGQLVVGTLFEREKLDEHLEQVAVHWKVARMTPVDRSLLRMAVYEMVYLKEVPFSIVINEAIELAKQFGTSETPAFINGILDNIRLKYQGERV